MRIEEIWISEERVKVNLVSMNLELSIFSRRGQALKERNHVSPMNKFNVESLGNSEKNIVCCRKMKNVVQLAN